MADNTLTMKLAAQDNASATINKVSRELRGLGPAAGKAAGPLGMLGTISGGLISPVTLAVGGVAALTAAAVGSVGAASALNEELQKANVVFGSSAGNVIKFAEGAASIGLSERAALGAAGALGNMFTTSGLAQDAAGTMSVKMVQLAADMASFNNQDPEEMLLKLRSGLAGEAEPLRQFGVLISEAAVQTFAYKSGIAAAGVALTDAQKVQARYGLILEQTAVQQGDVARSGGTLAAAQRQIGAAMENLGAKAGQALLPIIAGLATFLGTVLVPALSALFSGLSAIGPQLLVVAGIIGAVVLPSFIAWAAAATAAAIASIAAFSPLLVPIALVSAAVLGLSLLFPGLGDAIKAVIGFAIKPLQFAFGLVGFAVGLLGDVVNGLATAFGWLAERVAPVTGALAFLVDKGLAPVRLAIEAVKAAIDIVVGAATDMSLNFGDMGDKLHAVADEAGQSFQATKDLVRDSMLQMGLSFEDATARAQAAFKLMAEGMTLDAALVQVDADMKAVAATAAAGAAAVPPAVAGELAAGAPAVAAGAAAGITAPVVAATAEARVKAAAEALKVPGAITDSIVSGKAEMSPIRDLMKEIIAGSVSDAATLAQNAALLVNPKIAQGLRSNSSQTRIAMVRDVVGPLLNSIDTLKPGALESGRGIPPAIARALKENGPQAIAAMRDLVGDSSASLATLAAYAEKHGLEGIAAYIRGIQRKKKEAGDAAVGIAHHAAGLLKFDASGAGSSVVATFVAGMVTKLIAEIPTVNNAAYRFMAGTLGTSLPKSGPFAHPEKGAVSIIDKFTQTMGKQIQSNMGSIQAAMPTLNMGAAGSYAGAGIAGGAGTTIIFQSTFPPTPAQGAELARTIGPELERWRQRQGR